MLEGGRACRRLMFGEKGGQRGIGSEEFLVKISVA